MYPAHGDTGGVAGSSLRLPAASVGHEKITLREEKQDSITSIISVLPYTKED